MDWLDDLPGFAASQARSLATGRRWSGAMARRVEAAFAGVAVDDLDGGVTAADRLLADGTWVGAALLPLMRELRDDPGFVPPLRAHRDRLRIGAVLHDGPHVSITASVLSADALATLPTPATVVACGRVSVVRYCRAGGATLRVWDAPEPAGDLSAEAAPGCVAAAPVALDDGMVLTLDGRSRAYLLEDAAADVVSVTATLRAGSGVQAREYARNDGGLVRAATLAEAESRTRMLLTLLRVSGRADAGECFEAATRDAGFALRWAAMREWLAVDARGALPRLGEMTRDPNAEVRGAAQATLAMVEQRLAA